MPPLYVGSPNSGKMYNIEPNNDDMVTKRSDEDYKPSFRLPPVKGADKPESIDGRSQSST